MPMGQILVPRTTKACEFCGAIFECMSQGRRALQKYCGVECYRKTRVVNGRSSLRGKLRSATLHHCEMCRKEVYVTPAQIARGWRFCSLKCKGTWQKSSPEFQIMIQANKHKKARGRRNGMFGQAPHHGKGVWDKSPSGTPVFFRSTWEYTVAHYLNDLGVVWEYEPRRFDLGERSYLPDFWIPEWGVFWEVKGWFHKRHQNVVRLFREKHPEITLVVIGKQTYHGICKQMGVSPWKGVARSERQETSVAQAVGN